MLSVVLVLELVWITHNVFSELIVKFRINETLRTGEVRNLEETPKQKLYQGRGECLFIFRFYYNVDTP